MNFWWVNQNKTHKEEIEGGYMWSPKTKANGHKNPYYENMTKVKPGDLVFSYFKQQIACLGIITSTGYSQSKPFVAKADERWKEEGWMVNVDYRELSNKLRPKNHIDVIRSLLPDKYSPLTKDGDGKELYLTEISKPLAAKLLELIGEAVKPMISESSEHLGEVKTDSEAEEERIEKIIKKNREIEETEKETIVKARKGQGKFREDVIAVHQRCPFTGVNNPSFLRAGHLKPWSKCSDNNERIDPLNGLPLTPVADHLLDKGYISFEDNGSVVFSSRIKEEELKAMGIDTTKQYKIKIFSNKQREYIKYHMDNIFKRG